MITPVAIRISFQCGSDGIHSVRMLPLKRFDLRQTKEKTCYFLVRLFENGACKQSNALLIAKFW